MSDSSISLNNIHPRAIVSPEAQIAEDVVIHANAIIDEGVIIGSGTVISPRVHVYPGTVIESSCQVFDGAILGAVPQDLKYEGGSAGLHIGANTTIREYCTLNSSVSMTQPTTIGSGVMLMAYVHVGHDCFIEDQVVLANRVQLGGHVQIGYGAVLGGGVAVQQFTHIGQYSFMGGTLKVVRDVPPWSRVLGDPIKWSGLNLVALRKAGFTQSEIATMKSLLKSMYSSSSIKEFFSLKKVDEPTDSDTNSPTSLFLNVLNSWYDQTRNGVVR